MLAMLYTMAIMRLVNGVIEKTRKKAEISIAEAATEINMPRMLIDLLHEGSHRELPSLQVLHSASKKALDWLKSYYWDSQKNAIPYRSGKSVDVRKEIRSKLRELAFSLKVKQNSGSSSSQFNGKRSKKQITRTLKIIVRLYSFFSSDAVFVLVELLLDASTSFDLVNSPEKIPINLSLDAAQAVFDNWKPVIIKVCRKEPELHLNLLKAVLDVIESRKFIRDDFGSEHFSLMQYDPEMQRIGVLSSLFMWLALVLKGQKLTQHEDEGTLTDAAAGCLPKTSLMELVRRCLLISEPENRALLDSALLLAELVRDGCLSEKHRKLSSLTKLYPRFAENGASDVNSIDLIQEEKYIRQAAEKLDVIKRRKSSEASVPSSQDNVGEDSNIWTIAKLWNPCPMGMLPRGVGSSGCLPVLDHGTDCESMAAYNSMDTEKHFELRHCSKIEASCDIETRKGSSLKRTREIQSIDLCAI